MQYRQNRISEPINKSVRINKNENDMNRTTMIKGNYNSSAKKEPYTKMEFSIAQSE